MSPQPSPFNLKLSHKECSNLVTGNVPDGNFADSNFVARNFASEISSRGNYAAKNFRSGKFRCRKFRLAKITPLVIFAAITWKRPHLVMVRLMARIRLLKFLP